MSYAEQFRPKSFDDMVGQEKLVGKNGILTNMLTKHTLQSSIFYGPPGCGKTTAARIIAEQSGYPLFMLNAVTAGLKDIKEVASHAVKTKDSIQPVLLYLDEIQYFNKKQQQSLLPFVESGEIILLAATTDNPYYCCYDALLSRCVIIEFKPITADHIFNYFQQKILPALHLTMEPNALRMIADMSSGDIRRAFNLLELVHGQISAGQTVTKQNVMDVTPNTNMTGFDLDGDDHFALISGLQKSIRGSDPNAAVFYLARLLEGGDLLSPCRRLLVIAHEDIGLAQPDAAAYVYACVETAKQLGLPEANKPLTNAVIYLAISPKCSTCENTYYAAVEDIKNGKGGVIPQHLRHAYSKGYDSPHNHPNHWCKQQYLPDDLQGHIYYVPQNNLFEQQAANYWSRIMNQT